MVCLQCIRVGIGWVARYQLCSCVSCGQCRPTTSSLPKCQLANWCTFRWPSSSTFSLPVFTSWWTGSTCYKTYLNYNGGLRLMVHVWSVRKLRGFCPILSNTYFKTSKFKVYGASEDHLRSYFLFWRGAHTTLHYHFYHSIGFCSSVDALWDFHFSRTQQWGINYLFKTENSTKFKTTPFLASLFSLSARAGFLSRSPLGSPEGTGCLICHGKWFAHIHTNLCGCAPTQTYTNVGS